jgi:hypothetical protein
MLFTIFVFGGSTVPALKALGISLGCPPDPDALLLVDGTAYRKKCKAGGKKSLTYYFLEFEYKLKSLLTRSPEAGLGCFALAWSELTAEEQQAAKILGYDDDPNVVGKTWPEANHAWGPWEDLGAGMQEAAEVLGLDSHKWPPPDFGVLAAANSLVTQNKSGHDAAYDEIQQTKQMQVCIFNPAAV